MKKSLRFAVLRRDNFACVYCGAISRQTRLEVDHLHPKWAGGVDHPDNLVTACWSCNRGKRGELGVPAEIELHDYCTRAIDGWESAAIDAQREGFVLRGRIQDLEDEVRDLRATIASLPHPSSELRRIS